jgi:hypothetical protein
LRGKHKRRKIEVKVSLFFFNGEGDGVEKEQREYDENALGTEWTLCGVHLYERLVWA